MMISRRSSSLSCPTKEEEIRYAVGSHGRWKQVFVSTRCFWSWKDTVLVTCHSLVPQNSNIEGKEKVTGGRERKDNQIETM
jgi:hypothetical protein